MHLHQYGDTLAPERKTPVSARARSRRCWSPSGTWQVG